MYIIYIYIFITFFGPPFSDWALWQPPSLPLPGSRAPDMSRQPSLTNAASKHLHCKQPQRYKKNLHQFPITQYIINGANRNDFVRMLSLPFTVYDKTNKILCVLLISNIMEGAAASLSYHWIAPSLTVPVTFMPMACDGAQLLAAITSQPCRRIMRRLPAHLSR